MNSPNLGGIQRGGFRLAAMYARMAAWAIVFVLVAIAAKPATAAGTTTLLWSAPSSMAAGDDFLVVGYDRGVELWRWQTGLLPVRIGQRPGPAVTALYAGDSSVAWCQADSALVVAVVRQDQLVVRWQLKLPGQGVDLSSSDTWIAANVAGDSVLLVPRAGPGPDTSWWSSGRVAGLGPVALRDSTLAVGGGGIVDLVRLRPAATARLDTISLGSFVQDAVWAGDTLAMAFGFSGLKLVATAGDRFDGVPLSRSPGDAFTVVAVTDRTWAAFDIFGAIEVFARGDSLTPAAVLSSGGTLRAAAGRGSEHCVLSPELGMSLLNVFTPQVPFWSGQQRLPGFVRSLASSSLGMLALADFAGVYRLGDTLAWWLMEHPYNAADLDADSQLVAATTLLGGVGIFRLSTQLEQSPLAVVRPPGFVRHGRVDGDRLYVLNTPSCDSGLSEYDISDPTKPLLVAKLPVCATVRDLELVPGGVALALADSGIWVYPRSLSGVGGPLSRTVPPETWRQLAWHAGELWSLGGSGDLVRWQWSNPQLFVLDRFPTTPTMQAFAVWANRLATVDSTGAVTIWAWQAGGSLTLQETFEVQPAARQVEMIGDTVWVADRDAVIRIELSPTAGIDDGVPAAVIPRLLLREPPWPNPFNGAVRVAVHLEPGDWRVDIINVLGQRVTGWSGRARQPQRLRLDWRPTAAQASGVYFVRAYNAGQAETRSAVFMK